MRGGNGARPLRFPAILHHRRRKASKPFAMLLIDKFD
jgi:hypothetical protein